LYVAHKGQESLVIEKLRQRMSWAEAGAAWTEMAVVIGKCNGMYNNLATSLTLTYFHCRGRINCRASETLWGVYKFEKLYAYIYGRTWSIIVMRVHI